MSSQKTEDGRQIGGGWDVKTILLINCNQPHCTEWPLSPQRCREHIYFAIGGTVIVIGKIQEYNTHVIRVIDFNYSYIFHSHDTNKTLTVKPWGNVNIKTYQVSIDTFYDVELRKNKKKWSFRFINHFKLSARWYYAKISLGAQMKKETSEDQRDLF